MKSEIIECQQLADGYKLEMTKLSGPHVGRKQYIVAVNPPTLHEAPEVHPRLYKAEAYKLYAELLVRDMNDTF